MSDRERTEDGRFVESIALEDVRQLFDEVEGPVLTSTDVAGAFDCSNEAARQKLSQLSERGAVASRETGRTVVYWRTEERSGSTNGGQAETESDAV